MKNHLRENGQLLQTNKKYSALKQKQKEQISLWLIRCNKKAKKGKTQSRRNRRCGQEILWKRKISAIMGAEHLTMERGTGSL